jgi:hypothetical protein
MSLCFLTGCLRPTATFHIILEKEESLIGFCPIWRERGKRREPELDIGFGLSAIYVTKCRAKSSTRALIEQTVAF